MNWDKRQYVTDDISIIKTTGENKDNSFTGVVVYSQYTSMIGLESKTFNKKKFNKTMKPIQYLKTQDNHSFYKVNHELKRITRICANRRTFPEYVDLDTIMEGLVKARKNDWHQVENLFFVNNEFEWDFEGNRYKTSEISCDEKILQKNDGKVISEIYQYLVWHNGFVWATYCSGNYYPKMPLVRIDNQGKTCRKWTDIKYLKNFIKLA